MIINLNSLLSLRNPRVGAHSVLQHTYINTYHSRFIPEGVAETSQIFLQMAPTLYQNDLAMRNTADVTGGKPIAVWLQSISGGDAVNPLVAFYDIHGRKIEVLFFCFVPDTTRDSAELLYPLLTAAEVTAACRYRSGSCGGNKLDVVRRRTLKHNINKLRTLSNFVLSISIF
jgi:hypothetical protein